MFESFREQPPGPEHGFPTSVDGEERDVDGDRTTVTPTNDDDTDE